MNWKKLNKKTWEKEKKSDFFSPHTPDANHHVTAWIMSWPVRTWLVRPVTVFTVMYVCTVRVSAEMPPHTPVFSVLGVLRGLCQPPRSLSLSWWKKNPRGWFLIFPSFIPDFKKHRGYPEAGRSHRLWLTNRVWDRQLMTDWLPLSGYAGPSLQERVLWGKKSKGGSETSSSAEDKTNDYDDSYSSYLTPIRTIILTLTLWRKRRRPATPKVPWINFGREKKPCRPHLGTTRVDDMVQEWPYCSGPSIILTMKIIK